MPGHDDGAVSRGDGAGLLPVPLAGLDWHVETAVGGLVLCRGVQCVSPAAVFHDDSQGPFRSGTDRWVQRIPHFLAGHPAAVPSRADGRGAVSVYVYVERFPRTLDLPY